jgi:hypothetical protein
MSTVTFISAYVQACTFKPNLITSKSKVLRWVGPSGRVPDRLYAWKSRVEQDILKKREMRPPDPELAHCTFR